jgi:hypothetical protein
MNTEPSIQELTHNKNGLVFDSFSDCFRLYCIWEHADKREFIYRFGRQLPVYPTVLTHYGYSVWKVKEEGA